MINSLKTFFIHAGRISIFLFESLFDLKMIYKYPSLLLSSMFFIGPSSLPVIGTTAFIIGVIITFHMYIQLGYYIPPDAVGKTIAYSFLLEGAPLLVGIGIAGRVSSTYAAEVGTMKVTEQIDALKMSGINPVTFLLTPRLWASIIMGPLLFFYCFIGGVLGGFVMSKLYMHLPSGVYWRSAVSTVDHLFIVGGIIKSVVFAMAGVFISVYAGLHAEGGSSAVGKMTTKSVVYSVIVVAILDYIVNAMVFG